MTNERSNGYAAGRDSLRWAVEKSERLEAENEELKRKINRMLDIMECNDPGNARYFEREEIATKQQENEA